jgi:hypothetical protein
MAWKRAWLRLDVTAQVPERSWNFGASRPTE